MGFTFEQNIGKETARTFPKYLDWKIKWHFITETGIQKRQGDLEMGIGFTFQQDNRNGIGCSKNLN